MHLRRPDAIAPAAIRAQAPSLGRLTLDLRDSRRNSAPSHHSVLFPTSPMTMSLSRLPVLSRVRTPFLILVALLAGLQTPESVHAQETPVQRIRANPDAFLNQDLVVVGKVVRYLDMAGTTSAFYLEDDYGVQLRIVTSETPPPTESRWRIRGLIALEGTGDPYLVESARAPDTPVAEEAGPIAPPDEDSDGVPDAADLCPVTAPGAVVDVDGCVVTGGMNRLVLGGLGAVAVVLLIWGMSGLVKGGTSRQTPPQTATATAYAPAPAPQNLISSNGAADEEAEFYAGKTVRFARPTTNDGTLKLLPGRLEVLGGPDGGNEIRFVHPGGEVPEVTFGRSEGRKFRHIQLPAPTVSRRHALMRFDGSAWSIANFSETNPVVVNDTPLNDVGVARVLSDGDQLEFGEVSFKYHAR